MKRFWSILFTSIFLFGLAACGDDTPGTQDDDAEECGNGDIEGDETCDDGNTTDGDGCSSVCTLEEVCDDTEDNDGDGLIDCEDPQCNAHLSCQGPDEDCDNDLDDDGDDAIDCDDADCVSDPACLPDEICDNDLDDDGDDDIDCDDTDCASDPACAPEEICDNDLDDDGDDDIDCADADCASDAACAEICDNDLDDDGDDDIDCEDEDCASDPDCAMPDEDCDNDIDDDGDELADCADTDCATFHGCIDEICDNDIDDDGDGDTNCDDDECVAHAVCQCGDGEPDTGEACDEGDLNNDRAPNMCREDCTIPFCGDTVVDPNNQYAGAPVAHEQCDGGDNCNTDCTYIDPTLACDEGVTVVSFLAGDLVGADPDQYQVAFELNGSAGVVTPGVECGDDAIETAAEAVYLFTPTVTGTFLATTVFPTTEVDTLVYVRTPSCDASGTVACNDDVETGDLRSQVYFTVTAGSPTFIFVDSHLGERGGVTLEVAPVDIVGVDVACAPPYLICEDGLACITSDDMTTTCQASAAPTADFLLAVFVPDAVDPDGVLKVRLGGADANEDVLGFVGSLGNDSDPDLVPISIEFSSVSYGDGYEANLRLGFGLGQSPITTGLTRIAGVVVDSEGNESALIIGEIVEVVVAVVSEACDGFSTICADTLSCILVGLDATCQAGASAPVIDTIELRWVASNERLLITATGTDADGDVQGLRVRMLDSVDAEFDQITLDFHNDLLGETAWEGRTALYLRGGAPVWADNVASIEAFAVDATPFESATGLTAVVPWPPTVGVGVGCDPEGVENVCEADLLCDPVTEICREVTFEIHDCSYDAATDETVVVFDVPVSASDDYYVSEVDYSVSTSANIFLFDVYQGRSYREYVYYLDDVRYGGPGSFIGLSGPMSLSVTGLTGLLHADDTHIFCHVTNYAGETTNYVRADLVPTQGFGMGCDPAFANLCAPELACQQVEATWQCGEATAPEVALDAFIRTSWSIMTAIIDVSDIDADFTSAVRVAWLMEDGTDIIVPRFLSPTVFNGDPDVSGNTIDNLGVDISIPLVTGEPLIPIENIHFIETVDIEVTDIAGKTFLIQISINRDAGEGPCEIADADYQPCRADLICDSNVCVAP